MICKEKINIDRIGIASKLDSLSFLRSVFMSLYQRYFVQGQTNFLALHEPFLQALAEKYIHCSQ